MDKILKIIKVNSLGLIDIPLLLISTGIKLALKSLERLALVLGIAVTLIFLSILSLIIKYPGEFFDGIGWFIAVLIVFGGIIMTIVLALVMLGSIGTFFLTFVTGMLTMLLTFTFELLDAIYEIIYSICQKDFEYLCEEETQYKWFCSGFLLLKGINTLVIKMLSLAVLLGGIGCVAAVGYSYIMINNRVNDLFGIGVFTYLKMFPKVEMVFAIIYYLVLGVGFIMIVMILTSDWAKMGQDLRDVTENYEAYLDELDSKDLSSHKVYLECAMEEGRLEEKYQHYLKILDELMVNIDDIKQQVELTMTIKKDTYMVYKLGEYIATLENISMQFSTSNHQMTAHTFQKHVIPLITKAESLYKQLSGETVKVLSKAAYQATSTSSEGFFKGCDNLDDYKKRYRALSKVYHPDEGGDNETFVRLQTEYEGKISELSN